MKFLNRPALANSEQGFTYFQSFAVGKYLALKGATKLTIVGAVNSKSTQAGHVL